MNEIISKTTVINALKGYNHFEAQFELTYSEFKKDMFPRDLFFYEILRFLLIDNRIEIYSFIHHF